MSKTKRIVKEYNTMNKKILVLNYILPMFDHAYMATVFRQTLANPSAKSNNVDKKNLNVRNNHISFFVTIYLDYVNILS